MSLRTSLRSVAAGLATLAITTTGAVALAAPAEAGRVTDYGFGGRAYGTKATVGAAGAESARTVPAYLGCTRRTGVKRSNTLAETGAGTGAALQLRGVNNRSWSYRTRKAVGTKSRSKVARAVLGDPEGPHITFEALATSANAFAKRRSGKLAARSNYTAGKVDLQTGTELDGIGGGLGGLLDEINDQPGNQLEIPGLGVLSLGGKHNVVRARSATANASALRAVLYGADTVAGGGDDIFVLLGKSRASVRKDQVAGIFGGRAVPAEASLLGDVVRVGRVNDTPLPCEGTAGKVREASTAGGNLLDLGAVDLGALRARTYGLARKNRSAKAWTEGSVASLDLGGVIELTGVRGRATVTTNRAGRITGRSTRGTQIASLKINGDERGIPKPGQSIEVPEVAKLTFFVTDKSKRGVEVTAVRATLLDGSGAVIDLGEARTFIKRN